MKGRSILSLVVGLAILSVGSLAVLAQSQRYPTNAEVLRLRQQFGQSIPSIRQSTRQGVGYGFDSRTASEIQSRTSYVRAWSRVEPMAAPFFGEWRGQENWLSIFPSNVRGRVCIIDVLGDGPDVFFSLGFVSNGQIRTNGGGFEPSVIITEQNYLELIDVYENKARGWDHVYPRPLQALTDSFLHGRKASKVIQQFNAAGCTASLPNRRR